MGLSPVHSQVTNFSQDIAQAIDDGLGWLDRADAFQNPSPAGEAAGLVALALLEKRESADLFARPSGYENALPEDQQRLDRVMAFIIQRAQTANRSFKAYRDGGDMMALSLYLRTGGPDQPGAVRALSMIFDRSISSQNPTGYWDYTGGNVNDSSTTQLVMAGLAAVRGVLNDPAFADAERMRQLDLATSNTMRAYQTHINGDGGHGYHAGNGSSYQQTASGLWGQIIGGADLNDASVQRYLSWIHQRYNYQTIEAARASWRQAYYYYLWSSAKAFTFIEDSGVAPAPGNLGIEQMGMAAAGGPRLPHRDPALDPRVPRFGAGVAGYYADPHEPARWYYDYAYTLLSQQEADGQFNGGGHGVWNQYSGQAYPLLVLERSVGGGCVDSDQDGICDGDDNCPGVANPNQNDRDGDGIGDDCDLCPDVGHPGGGDLDRDGIGDGCDNCHDVPNPDQTDQDLDGRGDLCDPCPNQQGDESDQDGDGIGAVCDNCASVANPDQIDRDEDGRGDACDPCPLDAEADNRDPDGDGLGIGCDNCVAEPNPGQEDRDGDGFGDVCDNCLEAHNPEQRDVDGDGIGDLCDDCTGDPGPEICDGFDNDCNGLIDDALWEQACDTGLLGVCAQGEERCEAGFLDCLPRAEPQAEVCDGLDNDCDGAVDEEIEGLNEPCATGLPGICAQGIQICFDGRLDCGAGEQAVEERCNGLDDNCDGHVDEEVRNACGLCGPLGADICNGIDDDCDGEIDEDPDCPEGQSCLFGECHEPCQINECPGGFSCVEGLCVDPCLILECEPGERCEAGYCTDPCAELDCQAEEICFEGRCLEESCLFLGCPEGQRCFEQACMSDPCAGIDCGVDSFCREGLCVRSCATLSCPFGEICSDGECQPSDCALLQCPDGEVCHQGGCFEDYCLGVECLEEGQICIDGFCEGDPCIHIDCPPNERCQLSEEGSAQCVMDWVEPGEESIEETDGGSSEGQDGGGSSLPSVDFPDLGVDGGEGSEPAEISCNCRLGAEGQPLFWGLLLLLILIRRRDRSPES